MGSLVSPHLNASYNPVAIPIIPSRKPSDALLPATATIGYVVTVQEVTGASVLQLNNRSACHLRNSPMKHYPGVQPHDPCQITLCMLCNQCHHVSINSHALGGMAGLQNLSDMTVITGDVLRSVPELTRPVYRIARALR